MGDTPRKQWRARRTHRHANGRGVGCSVQRHGLDGARMRHRGSAHRLDTARVEHNGDGATGHTHGTHDRPAAARHSDAGRIATSLRTGDTRRAGRSVAAIAPRAPRQRLIGWWPIRVRLVARCTLSVRALDA